MFSCYCLYRYEVLNTIYIHILWHIAIYTAIRTFIVVNISFPLYLPHQGVWFYPRLHYPTCKEAITRLKTQLHATLWDEIGVGQIMHLAAYCQIACCVSVYACGWIITWGFLRQPSPSSWRASWINIRSLSETKKSKCFTKNVKVPDGNIEMTFDLF